MKTLLAIALTAACLAPAPATAQVPDPPPVVGRAEFDAKYLSLDARLARIEAALGLRTVTVAPVVVQRPAEVVVYARPFAPSAGTPGTTPATPAPPAVGVSTSWTTSTVTVPTYTAAGGAARAGVTSGCANGQCDSAGASGLFPNFRPFGGRFRQ